jgi:hypothetical protein
MLFLPEHCLPCVRELDLLEYGRTLSAFGEYRCDVLNAPSWHSLSLSVQIRTAEEAGDGDSQSALLVD